MVVVPPNTKPRLTALSFSTTEALAAELRQRLPQYGDRSKVINILLRRYLNGQIEVKIPERKL